MIFSSILFLYYFLPFVLIIYFLVPRKYKNITILIASLIFYFYGEPRYMIILLFSCFINYYTGKIIEHTLENSRSKVYLFLGVLINFGLLFYFKYFNFFLDNLNIVFHQTWTWTKIIMPIGISFYTFQATSYIIDIYRKKITSAKSIWSFATYLCLFPQLIAGPIVRYQTIFDNLEHRKENFHLFASGIKRFIIGLCKKVMIANLLGELSQNLVSMSSQTILSYWMQAIINTFQIYFDFSGYSDMAIGLGLMFGFKFLENFNYPLLASSITDFWRRWHISLSTWFRDYIYIPLGGNRAGTVKKYRNILIVWMLTGFWHGANWNFIIWGIYFAILLIIEKNFLLKFLEKHKIISHLYTMILIMISFIIFNQQSLTEITNFLKNMCGFNRLPFSNIETAYYIKNSLGIVILAGITCGPWLSNWYHELQKNKQINKLLIVVEPVMYMILLFLISAFIIDESFNPFLYFRF